MFVNVSVLRIDPARMPQLLEIFYRQEVIDQCKALGMLDISTTQLAAEPGMISNATFFNSPEDSQKMFTSPFYAELVKEFKPFFLSAPERYTFNMLVHRKFKERVPHMFINDTVIKIEPGRVDEFIKTLWAPDVIDVMLKLDVFIEASTLHSNNNPGTIHSLSSYAKPEDAKLVFSNPDYANLLGKLKPFLLAAPERVEYVLLRTDVIPFSAERV